MSGILVLAGLAVIVGGFWVDLVIGLGAVLCGSAQYLPIDWRGQLLWRARKWDAWFKERQH